MKSLLSYLNESNNRISKLPDVLYHATASHLLSSIKKYGLGGKMPKHTWWDYDSTEYLNRTQGVFFATDEYVAASFLEASDDFANFADEYEDRYDKSLQIIVFAVNTKDLDVSKISVDSNNSTDEDSQTYFYDGIIPYNKLKIVYKEDF